MGQILIPQLLDKLHLGLLYLVYRERNNKDGNLAMFGKPERATFISYIAGGKEAIIGRGDIDDPAVQDSIAVERLTDPEHSVAVQRLTFLDRRFGITESNAG